MLRKYVGAAFNKVLVPNECFEATQLLSCKDPKHWAVQASHAISHVSMNEIARSGSCKAS